MGLLTDLLGDGNGTSGTASYGIPRTFAQPGQGLGINIGDVGRAAYMRCIDYGADVTGIRLRIDTSSGNISVAVLTSPAGRSNPNTRVATTDAIACPAIGDTTVSLGATVTTTRDHWFAISADNTTATFHTVGAPNAAYSITDTAKGIAAYNDGHHPIPASPSTIACFVPPYALVGV